MCHVPIATAEFQSTLPTRGSDDLAARISKLEDKLFQSTLPTRGSDDFVDNLLVDGGISIHAPHEGERLKAMFGQGCTVHISIHAPHEGERL